jgi:hypothetical protein
MLELVTIEEARQQIRADGDSDTGDDDLWLGLAIKAASAAVARWLKDSWRLYVLELDSEGNPVLDSGGVPVPEEDSNGDPIVLPEVRLAVLVEVASQYRYREGEGKDNVVTPDAGHGYVLNKASTALLVPLRKPTIA